MKRIVIGNKTKKILVCTALFFLCIGVLYSFVTTPYSQDVKVFFAAANQVKYQPSQGLDAIQSSWEIKGFGNRILFYLLYRAGDAAAGFTNKIAFERTALLFYSAFALVIMAVSAYLVPFEKKNKLLFFFLMFFAVFTGSIAMIMQTEMTCILLCFLMFALFMHGEKWSVILAGIVGSLVFFIKSICLLMIPAVYISTLFFKDKLKDPEKNYRLSVLSFVIAEVLLLMFVVFRYPGELVSMKESAIFEKTMLSENSDIGMITILEKLFAEGNHSLIGVPVLLAGMIAAVVFLCRKNEIQQKKLLIPFILMWLFPLDIILISNTYYQYQFFLLTYPAIITIAVLIRNESPEQYAMPFLSGLVMAMLLTAACWKMRDGLHQPGLFNYSTLFMAQVHLLILLLFYYKGGRPAMLKTGILTLTFAAGIFMWMNYTSAVSPFYRNINRLEAASVKINNRIYPEDFGDEPVLFLDRGIAAFTFDARSESPYFYNLPLTRWKAGYDWENQKKEYQRMLEYTGKYIVLDDSYISFSKYPELEKKLKNEYTKLKDNAFIYRPRWDYFTLYKIPSSPYQDENTCIWVRNEN